MDESDLGKGLSIKKAVRAGCRSVMFRPFLEKIGCGKFHRKSVLPIGFLTEVLRDIEKE